jgi:hypothetical protein
MMSHRWVYRLAIVAALVPIVLLLLIGSMRTESRPSPSKTTPSPVEFSLIAERFRSLRHFFTREAVEKSLGPPTERDAWEPEFEELEGIAEHSNRHLGMPSFRNWNKWTDPQDRNRWVAVLYAGEWEQDFMTFKVYSLTAKGL